MAGQIPPMVVEVLLETDRIKAQLNQLQSQFDQFGSKVGSQTKAVDGLAGGFKKLAVAAAAVTAIKMVAGTVQEVTQAASSLVAEAEGVRQTFGENSDVIAKWAESAAKTAGMSETAALQAAKSFGGFARSAGLAGDSASTFATGLAQAAGDLGSFFDVPTEDALRAIQSGLAGQTEPLRRYNILINDATLRQRALAMGLVQTTTEALSPQNKVLATQAEIMAQLGPAAGDFVKYAGDYGNSVKTVNAMIDNLKANVGEQLLPVMGELVQSFMPLIEQVGPLAEQLFKNLEPLISALVDAVGQLLPLLTPIFEVLGSVAETVASIFAAILPPILDIIEVILPPLQQIVDVFLGLINDIIPPLASLFNEALVPIISFLAQILEDYVVPMLDAMAKQLGDTLYDAITAVTDILVVMIDALKPIGQIVKDIEKATGVSFLEMAINLNPLIIALKLVSGILQFISYSAEISGKLFKGDFAGAAATIGMGFEKWKAARDASRVQYRSSGVDTTTMAGILAASGDLSGSKTTPPPIYTPPPLGGTAEERKAKEYADRRKKILSAVKEARADMEQAQKKYADATASAQERYGERIADAQNTFTKRINEITTQRDKDIASASKDHGDRVIAIQKDFASRLQDIVKQSMDRLRSAFSSAVGTDIGSLFASMLPKDGALSQATYREMRNGMEVAVSWWGQSINTPSGIGGVVESLRSKLDAARQLAANAAALSNAGYSQTFIEQVIGQGTDVGNQMAQEILNSAPETQAELKSLYLELEKVTESGVDKLAQTIYEKNGLATTELRNLYTATQADLVQALADEQRMYTEQVAEINRTFNEAFAEAEVTRDQAIRDAQAELTKSLAEAAQTLYDSLIDIRKKFNAEIAAMKGNLAGLGQVVSGVRATNSAAANAAMKQVQINTTVNAESNASPESIANSTIAAIRFGIPTSILTA
jgi:phage-related protein